MSFSFNHHFLQYSVQYMSLLLFSVFEEKVALNQVHVTFIIALTKGLLVPGVNVAFSQVVQQPFLLLKARYHLEERND